MLIFSECYQLCSCIQSITCRHHTAAGTGPKQQQQQHKSFSNGSQPIRFNFFAFLCFVMKYVIEVHSACFVYRSACSVFRSATTTRSTTYFFFFSLQSLQMKALQANTPWMSKALSENSQTAAAKRVSKAHWQASRGQTKAWASAIAVGRQTPWALTSAQHPHQQPHLHQRQIQAAFGREPEPLPQSISKTQLRFRLQMEENKWVLERTWQEKAKVRNITLNLLGVEQRISILESMTAGTLLKRIEAATGMEARSLRLINQKPARISLEEIYVNANLNKIGQGGTFSKTGKKDQEYKHIRVIDKPPNILEEANTYDKLLDSSTAIVDKTAFSLALLKIHPYDTPQYNHRITLITSPRRTGKSMLLSSHKYFLEVSVPEQQNLDFSGKVQEIKGLLNRSKEVDKQSDNLIKNIEANLLKLRIYQKYNHDFFDNIDESLKNLKLPRHVNANLLEAQKLIEECHDMCSITTTTASNASHP
uniref:Uncharacterized protein n=1 Tax=Ditylenchus dipsaci TaxID=166011 RepID=A0A915DGZ2_9BILA